MIDSYEVIWQKDISGDCPDEDVGSATFTDGSTSHSMTGLEEYSNYTITVIAMNLYEMVTSKNVTGRTQQAGKMIPIYELFSGLCFSRSCEMFYSVPSANPTFVNVSEVISSNMTVQWGAVDCIHRNGDLTGYSVRYVAQWSGHVQTKSVSGGGATQTIISGLIPSTNYSIEVYENICPRG